MSKVTHTLHREARTMMWAVVSFTDRPHCSYRENQKKYPCYKTQPLDFPMVLNTMPPALGYHNYATMLTKYFPVRLVKAGPVALGHPHLVHMRCDAPHSPPPRPSVPGLLFPLPPGLSEARPASLLSFPLSQRPCKTQTQCMQQS